MTSGALTKTIVAMKERLEGDMDKDTPQSTMPAISEAQRRKEREIVTKEVRVDSFSSIAVCVCVCVCYEGGSIIIIKCVTKSRLALCQSVIKFCYLKFG